MWTFLSRLDSHAVLTGRHLYKSFGPTSALQGASIAVNAGEIVAVRGSRPTL